MNGRLRRLDIVKAIACIGVYMHHFLLAYFPASYYGTEQVSRLYAGVDYLIASEPIGVVFNGDFWVAVFLLIAAFLQARKSMMRGFKPGRDTIKRYLRLMLPIIPAGIINYVIKYIMQITQYTYRGNDVPYDFLHLLYHMFGVQWVQSDGTVLGPLWMIYALFLGSVIAMFLGSLDRKDKTWPLLVYILMMIPALYKDLLFVPIVLGIILADLITFDRLRFITECRNKNVQIAIAVVLISASLYLAGYPSYARPGVCYAWIPYVRNHPMAYRVIHALAAFALVAGVCILPKKEASANAGTSKRRSILDFVIGHVYSIYLLHIIWIETVGYGLFATLVQNGTGLTTGGIIVFVVLSAGLAGSALLYRRYEDFCNKCVKKLTSWITW